MAPNQPSDSKRIAALENYCILDTPAEESFDRVTRLVMSALGADIVLISLVDKDRQWFKSRQGLSFSETSREISFCSHAIQGSLPFLVEDATKDPRFRDNPLVCSEPHIRAYAGIPLRTLDGHNIGTLCAIFLAPKKFTKEEIDILHDFAMLVMNELEMRRTADVDSLTGLLNRRAFLKEFSSEINRARRYLSNLSLISLDIDFFKKVNDNYGHAVGDAVIQEVANLCRTMTRGCDISGRLGGEEFVILLPETGLQGAHELAGRIRKTIQDKVINVGEMSLRITASFGIAQFEGNDNILSMLKRADAGLYLAKESGRNQVRIISMESYSHTEVA